MEDPHNDVRQSSYALLGDCAKYVYPQLQPFLLAIFPVLIRQLDIDQLIDRELDAGFSVVNNACWSVGEIALHGGKEMGPCVDKLLQRLVVIITNLEVPDSLNENAAIALGRMGISSSAEIAPHLGSLAGPFLDSMKRISHTDEKTSAYKGFVMIVAQNPQALEKSLVEFFTQIARYKEVLTPIGVAESELRELFSQVGDVLQFLYMEYHRVTNILEGHYRL
jgi:hypothetical protein